MAPSCGRDLDALRTATDVPGAYAQTLQSTRPAPHLRERANGAMPRANALAGVVA
jgi:hypothetical protein